MFRLAALALVCLAVVYAARIQDVPEAVRQLKGRELADYINKQGSWKATSYSRFEGLSKDQLRQYLGARKKPQHFRRKGQPAPKVTKLGDIPASFNSIDNWPQCKDIIGLIQDQSACGSCWAVSTTSAMSDRLCIASNGKIQKSISALDLMACCSECGYQCQGGWPDEAWSYFTQTGIVTGQNFTADGGCKPYPIAPCHLDPQTQKNVCPPEPTNDYRCEKKCQATYNDEKYSNDHYYGGQSSVQYFSNQNDAAIQELLKNGPIVAAFDVYEDFYKYKSGIYQYTGGSYVGGHAVRIVGYGTENGVDYWTVANSWDTYWGEAGYFRIRRGTDECSFEEEITSANADVERSLKDK